MDGSHARQQHGLDFEKWIKDTFFSAYVQTAYTAKWDATGVKFKSEYAIHTMIYSGLPVSIKTCKYGAPIGFGDAIRQFENDEDFLLIVGFWKNSGSAKKFVSVKAASVDAKKWKSLFEGKVTIEELKKDDLEDESKDESEEFFEIESKQESLTGSKIRKLDEIIKDKSIQYKKVRELAKKAKKEITGIDIVLNPKIDSKGQRRLQCSLPFSVFWEEFAKEAAFSDEDCTFWGEKVPLLK